MFIKKHQQPAIEFSSDEGHQAPTLVHCFSDRGDPFKSVLPQLIEAAGGDEEHVFVVESPLSELLDYTIWLHRHEAFPDGIVVDEQHRPFFDAVKVSLLQALAKLEQIQFVDLDEDEGDGWDALA